MERKFYLLALLLFLCSLLSKAMAASLPVVLLLTDYFKGRKINGKVLLEKAPFFLLALGFGVLAIYAQRSTEAMDDIVFFNLPHRIAFASYGFVTYLHKLLLPLELCAFYPYPLKTDGGIPMKYYIYIPIALGLVVYVIYSLRRTKKLFFGIGFYAITVFLVLQLLPVGGAIMADRYSYIPSIGLFYLLGEGLYLLWQKQSKWLPLALLGIFTMFFSARTFIQCGIWKDGMTLWNDVIDQYQTVAVAYNNRAKLLKDTDRHEEILSDLNRAIELKSNFVEAYNNRGNLLRQLKRYGKALKDFNKALELRPDYPETYNNRGTVYLNEKKFALAIDDFNKSIELKPNYGMAFANRGIAKFNMGEKEDGCVDIQQAINLGFRSVEGVFGERCR